MRVVGRAEPAWFHILIDRFRASVLLRVGRGSLHTHDSRGEVSVRQKHLEFFKHSLVFYTTTYNLTICPQVETLVAYIIC